MPEEPKIVPAPAQVLDAPATERSDVLSGEEYRTEVLSAHTRRVTPQDR